MHSQTRPQRILADGVPERGAYNLKKKKSQNMHTESPMLESAETTNIRTAQGLSVLT